MRRAIGRLLWWFVRPVMRAEAQAELREVLQISARASAAAEAAPVSSAGKGPQ
jgi:hypothetical protein